MERPRGRGNFPPPRTPVSPTFAIDPGFNVRIFAAGSPASLNAATAWIGGPAPLLDRALSILFEGVDPEVNTAVRSAIWRGVGSYKSDGARVWIYQFGASFRYLSEILNDAGHPLGGELKAALLGFEEALNRPESTRVMGILTVTPDSFSDGGQWLDVDAAVAHALRMVEDGADILDIGGESTRPGAAEVPADEELRRVLPVVERLRGQTKALISIDTRKAAVAGPCLEAGADWINDVSGLTYDPGIADVVARHPQAKLVLMHSRSRPSDERYSTEYDAEGRPVYDDVVADTMRWLRRQIGVAVERGVAPGRIWIDPGFGFGKTFEQNVELLRRLREYTSMGLPVLLGTSRKSSVGKLVGDLPPDQRLEGTAATVAWCIAQGASAVRVHDVREMARVARAADALR